MCFDDQTATYRYGPIDGAPDLTLSTSINDVDFEPWSGVGKAINENVTFYNGDYSYEVGAGFDRPFSEEEMQRPIRRFGWLEVAQNGEPLANLACVPETVTYGFGAGIYDAKVAAGLTWDDYSKTWRPDPNHPQARPARAPILMTGTGLAGTTDCLPPAELKLYGITLDYHISDLAKLIPPVLPDTFIDRGVILERFIYEGLRIDADHGAIIAMEATTPFWKMPSGIQVGSTRGDVISILGRAPNGASPTAQSFGVPVCPDDRESSADRYVEIVFGHDKRVQSINLASPLP